MSDDTEDATKVPVQQDLWFPPNTSKTIRFLRFVNVLDDARNILSPTKINVWSANVAAISTFVASILGWLGHNITGMETMWAGSVGWLTHAYIAHHNDKKERNKQTRMLDGIRE